MKSTRVIIITVPPECVAEEVQDFREPLCRCYKAEWALRYPPHVTMRTGMVIPDDELENVYEEFQELVSGTQPFKITAGPSAYSRMEYEGEEHFFLYLPVMKDKNLLAFNRKLLTYTDFKKSDRVSFEPHLTLMWGDMPEKEEKRIRTAVNASITPYGKKFSWTCSSVSFYILKDDKWVLLKNFPFGI